MTHGELVREQRLAAGLTLADLAKQVGCSESYLSLIESGKRRGSRWFLEHLTLVLEEVTAA